MAHKNSSTGMYEENIDGKLYEFEKLGADDATDMLLDLMKVVGKPLSMAAAILFDKDNDPDRQIDPNIIGTIVESLVQGVDKNICKPIIKKLTSEKATCEGKKINYNLHYQESLFHMCKVLKAALEVQFGSFFAEALGSVGVTSTKGIMNRATRSNGLSGDQ